MPKTFSETLLEALKPLMTDDLSIYLTGIGENFFDEIEEWVRDTDDGKSGYSLLVDANRAPDEVIPWLAQFVGAKITIGLSGSEQRNQLTGLGNWKRGTVAALQAAPLPYLTGSQTVIIKERFTSAYNFEVITYASETVDQTAVLAALTEQKPAGLVMTYVVFSGQKAFTMRDSALRGSVPDAIRLII